MPRRRDSDPICRALAVLVAFGVGTLVAGSALAKDPPAEYKGRNVAILPFVGDDVALFERAVGAAIFAHERLKKADAEELIVAAERAGTSLSDIRAGFGLTPHCNVLRIDAVIAGEVFLEGKTYTLGLKVYDGESGEVLGVFDFPPVRRPPFSAKFAENVRSTLAREAIRYSYAGPTGARSTGLDDDDDFSLDDDDDDDDGPESRPAGEGPAKIVANIGFGIAKRFFEATVMGGGGRTLSPALFPALHVAVEALPLKFFLDGLASSIGVHIGGLIGFPAKGFKTDPACDRNDPGCVVDIPNSYLYMFGGVFYRWALPVLEERIEIIPSVAYSTFRAGFRDTRANSYGVDTTFAYGAVRLGGRAMVRITPEIHAWAGGYVNIVTTVGAKDAATARILAGNADYYYGDAGRTANGLGWRVEVGGSYVLPEPIDFLHAGLHLYLHRYRAQFTGTGANVQNFVDVLATDLSLGGVVFVGYLFR